MKTALKSEKHASKFFGCSKIAQMRKNAALRERCISVTLAHPENIRQNASSLFIHISLNLKSSLTTIHSYPPHPATETTTDWGHVEGLLCRLQGVRSEEETAAIMSSHQPQGPGNGPPSAGMSIQHQQGIQPPPQPSQSMSQQNLNQIVRLCLLGICLIWPALLHLSALCFLKCAKFEILKCSRLPNGKRRWP
jgi:hypothetical protein